MAPCIDGCARQPVGVERLPYWLVVNQTLRAWLTLCLYITSSRRTTSTPDQQCPQHGAGDGERVHPSTRPVVLRTPPQVLLLQLFDPFSQPATSRFASSRSHANEHDVSLEAIHSVLR